MKTIEKLLEITVYSGVLFAAILLLKLCFKGRMSPLLNFAVWGLLIVRLLVPVTLESSFRLFALPEAAPPVAVRHAQTGAANTETLASENAAVYLPAVQQAPDMTLQGENSGYLASISALRPAMAVQEILLLVWLSGASIGLIYLALLHYTLRRKIRRNAAAPSRRLLDLFDGVKQEMGIRSNLRLICQYEYGTPALLFPRTVLMPVDMLASMNDEQVRYALRHELTHFRRCDQVTGLLLSVLNAVYWFNPVVWLAFPMIRADMETACDGAVVRGMNDEQKSAYASLIVSLFARPAHRQLALGMALESTKKMAERRVRGVFMRNRSGKSVRLASALLAVVLLAACFTTACQPTPSKPPVVSKNDGKLEERLSQTATPLPSSGGSATASAQILRQRMSIPESLKDELSNDENTVRVHIDAPIDVPDVSAMSVYSEEFASFTLEQVEKMHQTLLGGAQLYEPGGPTREYWQEQILFAQQEIADAKKRGDADWKVKMEEALAFAQEQYANTPENMVMKPASLEFSKDNSGADALSVMVNVNGRMMVLNVYNTDTRAGAVLGTNDNGIPTAYQFQPQLSTPAGVSTSRQDAQRQASEIASSLDGNLKPAALMVGSTTDPDSPQVWMVAFTRTIDGVPTPFDQADLDDISSSAPPLPYERLWIMIDDKGLAGMEWNAPMELTGKVNSDAALMPYSEIEAKAKTMLLANSRGRFEDMKKVSKYLDVKIDRITLGFTRITLQDKPGKFLLVPVWDFYGKEIPDTSGYPDKKKKNMPDYEHMMSRSLLTINAIDGSIIDRSQGY